MAKRFVEALVELPQNVVVVRQADSQAGGLRIMQHHVQAEQSAQLVNWMMLLRILSLVLPMKEVNV